MDDMISRQAAIDAVRTYYDDEYALADSIEELIEKLPSAQPEIVRCKNCKHNQLPSTSGNADCEIYYGMTNKNGFCHRAERRT